LSGQTDTIHTMRLTDRVRALELAMRHLGLLVERPDMAVAIDVRWQKCE
jgi:hypothetical protein